MKRQNAAAAAAVSGIRFITTDDKQLYDRVEGAEVIALASRPRRKPEDLPAITAWPGRHVGMVIEQEFISPEWLITGVTDVGSEPFDIALATAPVPFDERIELRSQARSHTVEASEQAVAEIVRPIPE